MEIQKACDSHLPCCAKNLTIYKTHVNNFGFYGIQKKKNYLVVQHRFSREIQRGLGQWFILECITDSISWIPDFEFISPGSIFSFFWLTWVTRIQGRADPGLVRTPKPQSNPLNDNCANSLIRKYPMNVKQLSWCFLLRPIIKYRRFEPPPMRMTVFLDFIHIFISDFQNNQFQTKPRHS